MNSALEFNVIAPRGKLYAREAECSFGSGRYVRVAARAGRAAFDAVSIHFFEPGTVINLHISALEARALAAELLAAADASTLGGRA